MHNKITCVSICFLSVNLSVCVLAAFVACRFYAVGINLLLLCNSYFLFNYSYSVFAIVGTVLWIMGTHALIKTDVRFCLHE